MFYPRVSTLSLTLRSLLKEHRSKTTANSRPSAYFFLSGLGKDSMIPTIENPTIELLLLSICKKLRSIGWVLWQERVEYKKRGVDDSVVKETVSLIGASIIATAVAKRSFLLGSFSHNCVPGIVERRASNELMAIVALGSALRAVIMEAILT